MLHGDLPWTTPKALGRAYTLEPQQPTQRNGCHLTRKPSEDRDTAKKPAAAGPAKVKTKTKQATAKKATAKAKAARVMSPKAEQRRLQQLENKRTTIIQAALGLFSRFGLHGTSLDQIASAADVSKTNLLYYFSSKEVLYTSVMESLLDIWLSPLRGFQVEQDPIEAIDHYIRVKLEMSRDHPAESRLFCMEVMQGAPLIKAHLEKSLRDLVETKVAVIEAWIRAGKLAEIAPYHLIFALWSTTQHYADFSTQVQAITGKTLADPQFFDETRRNLTQLILAGIKPRS